MSYPIYFSGPNANGGSVTYNNGILVGYAWSPAYGWIQFKNDGTALALSLQNPNDTESTEWANGLIKLSGTDGGSAGNVAYSVVFDPAGTTNSINHWAWGGNVLGWIDFSGVIATPAGAPVVNISANPTYMITGSSSVVKWLGSNLAPTGCVSSGGGSGTSSLVNSWPALNRPSSGTYNTGSLSVGSHLFSIKCLGIGANSTVYSPEDSVLVKVYEEGACIDPSANNFGDVASCEYPSCPAGQIFVGGECINPLPTSCTTDQFSSYSVDEVTGVGTPESWPCYCSVHSTEISPVDCVNFCRENSSSCKKKPHYEEI
jgi:hypothetical protein